MSEKYLKKGLDRLMSAILLQAVRDCYSAHEYTRIKARLWLRENGVSYAADHGFGFPIHRFEAWINSGFEMPQETIDYMRTSGSKGGLV